MKLAPNALVPLIAAVRESAGLATKREIRPAARHLGLSAAAVQNGDDAAALPEPDGTFTLFAAEGMQPAFVAAEPYFAGLCAVLTNVSDIAAMGGRPRAIVDVLWAGDSTAHTRALLDGLAAGSQLFQVPIVGGHTGRSSGRPQLCAAIVGRARKLISAFAARPGQVILCCVDLNGSFRGASLHFDAMSGADPRALRDKLELLPQLAEAGLCAAGKDISMAGILGTLLMLLETSGCGAQVDLAALPAPGHAVHEPQRWLEAFPSYGYLLAVEPEHAETVIARFAAHGVAASVIATLTRERALDVHYQQERACYWDLAREPLMGFGS